MNVLVLNLGMDAAHPTLGHTTAWVNALARRVEHVSVITMFAGKLAVEENVTVHSLGKELGRSEARRLASFYRLSQAIVGERRIDVCFAHMAPLFATLFSPIARSKGIPIVLWYAHTSVTRRLRAAHAVADRCITPAIGSFPLASEKLSVVGHGIDTDVFVQPKRVEDRYWDTIVSVGRITPIKQIDEMLDGLVLLRDRHAVEPHLELIGGPSTASDRRYEARLRDRTRALGLDRQVSFRGARPYSAVAACYHAGALVLNLGAGALDKAILEGMASGCLPISRNAGFAALANANALAQLAPAPGAEGLAECLRTALALDRSERDAAVAKLRGVVVEQHSLTTLMDRIVEVLAEVAQGRRAPSARGEAVRT
jgi:glycosyltransferase involved in cell wall biosynthesis